MPAGNGNNATVTESGGIYVAGRFAQGIKVPPAGWITCPANSTINGFSAWTDSLWCSISSTASNAYLVACCNNNSNTGFMGTYSHDLVLYCRHSGCRRAKHGLAHPERRPAPVLAAPQHLAHGHLCGGAARDTAFMWTGVLGASGTLSGPPEFGDGTGP